MGEVSFTTKEEPKPVKEDRSWYKTYCSKCPYFINDEILQMLHCIRPAGEECLAAGTLVMGQIIADTHNAMVKKLHEEKPKPIISELTKKRRAKIIKRRR